MAYHYSESGLDNVWLENGYTKHETPYGDGISIDDTEGLHKAIGNWLVNLPKPFNGAELRFIRLEMELTQRDLAEILGVDEQAVRRWEKSRDKKFHGAADRLLRAIYTEHLHKTGSVRRMVERLSTANQAETIDIHFQETADGWKPRGCLEAA
ncbi:helix-turn-helix domain-containing protein [Hoeflea sp. G2-23]|uniref:Helix-turn-helix domain-containing protein n=1 Tax=Hoeflea algicola TaxID=2983763 RepID=A0ABT3ZDV2_9HYPH|nr:helix-turn-helix domain-containing protein [Hoeflea algicola]MCY0149975.1 helix-turn-helix domain-containing protein [Hoeflea algicola]